MSKSDFENLILQDLAWISAREGAFGLWISALWPSHLDLSYEQKMEVFLFLLKRLLDKGKVYLEEPAGAEYGSREVLGVDVWAAPHAHMIEHIRRYWPEGISEENDIRLTDFWYDVYCPKILWFDEEKRKLVGS